MFRQHLTPPVEHLFNAQNKRVATVRSSCAIAISSLSKKRSSTTSIPSAALSRRSPPIRSLRTALNGVQSLKQFIARANLVHATLPELEFAPFDGAAITTSLARAFTGLSLGQEEAQAAPLIPTPSAFGQRPNQLAG